MSICLIKEVLRVSEPTGKSVKGPYAREEGAMVRDTLKETEGRPGRQEGSKCGSSWNQGNDEESRCCGEVREEVD